MLAAGEYQVSPEVRHHGGERRLMDHRENAASFEVIGAPATRRHGRPAALAVGVARGDGGEDGLMSVQAEAPAHRVTGPAALSGDWRRFFNLTMTLALTDWKLRFFGSALGYVWSLLRPLLLFGILYLVFSQIVKIGEARAQLPAGAADRRGAVRLLRRGHG